MTQYGAESSMISNSFEECKSFIAQFEQLLPEEKRTAIHQTISQIEASGGIQNEAQAQEILLQLLKGLGL